MRMRDYVTPAQNRPKEYASISMPELENRIKELDSTGQKIVSYHIRGFAPGEITQMLGCSEEYARNTIRHFTEQLLETTSVE